jgi:hypothetical protein
MHKIKGFQYVGETLEGPKSIQSRLGSSGHNWGCCSLAEFFCYIQSLIDVMVDFWQFPNKKTTEPKTQSLLHE